MPTCPLCKSKTTFELQKDGCDYFRCAHCTFLFHRREYGLSRLGHAVADHYDAAYWENEHNEARRREEEDSLNRAYELIYLSSISVKRILDFGCGLGVTVKRLRENLGIEAVGIDPFGRFEECDFLHKKTLSELTSLYGPESFDAIYSIEVFEHLEDPITVMRELDNLLKPGGKLLVNTMTWEEIERFDPELHYIDPLIRGHISIWSLQSLQQLGGLFGYTVSFMGARKYVVIMTKSDNESALPSPENLKLFRKIGSWYPQLMQEYMRLIAVEKEFENHGSYIRVLLEKLKQKVF